MRSDKREVSRLVKNILAVYLDASELTQEAGRRWYEEESARCNEFANAWEISIEQVAGAAAAISPGMRWKFVFAHLAALRANPQTKVPTYSREFVRRAVSILQGKSRPEDTLSGPKVTAFYQLLVRVNPDAVVIDGHAWNTANGACYCIRHNAGYAPPAAARVSPRRYRLAAQAYREAGEVLGEPGHSVQACVWVHWRELFKRGA